MTSAPSHEATDTSDTSNPTDWGEGARQWRITHTSSKNKDSKEACVPHHTPKWPLPHRSLHLVYWYPSAAACPWSSPRPSWDRVRVQLPRLQQGLTEGSWFPVSICRVEAGCRESTGSRLWSAETPPLGPERAPMGQQLLAQHVATVGSSVASRLHSLNVHPINTSQISLLEGLMACNVLHTCAHNV